MAIWTAFSEIVMGSAHIIIENQGLIKKTRILAHVLPLSKIVASIIPHLIFLLILVVLMLFYHLPFKIYFFQYIYYFFAMSVFGLGVGWLVASLNRVVPF